MAVARTGEVAKKCRQIESRMQDRSCENDQDDAADEHDDAVGRRRLRCDGHDVEP